MSSPTPDETLQERVSRLRSEGRLVDRFGRVATDLRISLIDKCNLRCTYCMPAEGLPWLPKEQLLTDDEIVRLARIAVEKLGIEEIRFTGGEPLLRPGLVSILDQVTSLSPRPQTALTTNGLGMARIAPALKDAGLDRVNISLDTLAPERFVALTRRDRLHDVLDGIAAAQQAGLTPVKINTVLMRGVNDDEAPALLRWCLAHGYELRFIEQMPLDGGHIWDRHQMITAQEILAELQQHFDLTPDPAHRGAAPAETWLVDGGPIRVGVIGSVTRPFCGDCDRTRLTADGQIRNCLFATEESDLRAALRGGASDDELADRWRTAMIGKRAGHGIDDPSFLQPARPMSAIGG
ncbi:GTP 3',8-cyclase MoaA [Blastococcus sp. Marseille-P5729]|uniref:GTP 3',8-cyclase MoaA n=1 Tax=Blastococcus sp. Marseille-P5729 TaxID=2086582 RepID=UPI000D0FB28C|nr:GTP 3',8-cyclase MoaA [Blastococcus sp. Marseille-P5729]